MTRKEWIEKNLPAYVSDKARLLNDGNSFTSTPNWLLVLRRTLLTSVRYLLLEWMRSVDLPGTRAHIGT